MAGIESLAKAGELGTTAPAVQTVSPTITGLGALTNPAVLGQAAIGQATVPPPELPPVAPVNFENRQAGVPDRITRRPPQGYRPGYDGEFDYGISPNYGVGLMSQNDPRYMGSKTQDAGITQLQRVAMENPELMYSGMSPTVSYTHLTLPTIYSV